MQDEPEERMAKRLLKVFIIDGSMLDTKAFPDNTDAKGKEGYYFTLEVVDSQGQSVPEYRFKSKTVRSYSLGWRQNCQFSVPNQGLGTQFKALKSVYGVFCCTDGALSSPVEDEGELWEAWD